MSPRLDVLLMRPAVPLALMAALLAAPALAEPIDGTVTSHDKILLARQVAVIVRLLDLSRGDHEITQQRIRPRGRQLPIAFRLHFDPAKVKPGHHYVLEAEITLDDNKPIFADRDPHPIDLTKITGPVTLYVRPVAHDGKAEPDEKPAPSRPAPPKSVAPPAKAAAPAMEKPAPAPTLAGITWHAETLNGHDLTEAEEPTLEISATGVASGSSACNRYSGPAHIDGPKLTFGPLAMTKMACPPAVAAIEADFAKAMAEVKAYRIEGGKLTLANESGATLIRFGRK